MIIIDIQADMITLLHHHLIIIHYHHSLLSSSLLIMIILAQRLAIRRASCASRISSKIGPQERPGGMRNKTLSPRNEPKIDPEPLPPAWTLGISKFVKTGVPENSIGKDN
jgi:hypothetical protein